MHIYIWISIQSVCKQCNSASPKTSLLCVNQSAEVANDIEFSLVFCYMVPRNSNLSSYRIKYDCLNDSRRTQK